MGAAGRTPPGVTLSKSANAPEQPAHAILHPRELDDVDGMRRAHVDGHSTLVRLVRGHHGGVSRGGGAEGADKMLVKRAGGDNGAAHKVTELVVRDEHLSHVEGGGHVGPEVRGGEVAAESDALGYVGGSDVGDLVGRVAHEPVADVLVAEEVAPKVGK
ncbi:hypothetical protein FGB62_58g149 [Gracilaria domingensis]|nr:hypothetical protein FGB62_58g149 [Gracilaria domingensis]